MTDIGRVRGNNEDAWLVEPELCAAMLADGMGGAACGEVGAAVTIESVAAYLRSPEEELSAEELAKEAIRTANRRVLEAARERGECRGMGSTIVLALWRLPQIIIANVGDSRAYLWRRGELRQLSYDQNLANEMRTSFGFREAEIRQLPHRNVLTMAIGTFEQVLIRTNIATLEYGDQILLCSDGLHGPLDDGAISEVLAQPLALRTKVEKLISCANEAGGPDNITAVLLQYWDEAADGKDRPIPDTRYST